MATTMECPAKCSGVNKMRPKTRSPIKDKPLRLPGQSVAEQRLKLIDDVTEGPILLAVFLVLLAGFEWWRDYTGMKINPVLFSFAAGLSASYAAFRIWRALPKLRALRQAAEGEQAVGQFLERLREGGFHVFHDVIGAGFNVDHVLIGPAGVFTVETKTSSKPSTGNAQINFDGKRIKVGSFEPDRDPVTQAKGQAGWLKAILAESTGRTFDVRPVLRHWRGGKV